MTEETLELVEPCAELELAYLEFLAESDERQHPYLGCRDEVAGDFAGFVRKQRDMSAGRGLPDGWVPATTYWLVADGRVILGSINLRHRLTPALEDYGGHVGYIVRPSARGRGYGTRMLTMALQKAREMGLTGVLITCDPKNVASTRMIRKHAGRLLSESPAKTGKAGRMTSRYWIDL